VKKELSNDGKVDEDRSVGSGSGSDSGSMTDSIGSSSDYSDSSSSSSYSDNSSRSSEFGEDDSSFFSPSSDDEDMNEEDSKLQEMYGSDEEDWYTAALRAKEKEKQRKAGGGYHDDDDMEDETRYDKQSHDSDGSSNESHEDTRTSLLKSGRKTSEMLLQKRDTRVADELMNFAKQSNHQSNDDDDIVDPPTTAPKSGRLANRFVESPSAASSLKVKKESNLTEQVVTSQPLNSDVIKNSDVSTSGRGGGGGFFQQFCGCFVKKDDKILKGDNDAIELTQMNNNGVGGNGSKKLTKKEEALLARTEKYRLEAEAVQHQPLDIVFNEEDDEDEGEIGYESEESYHSSDDSGSYSDSEGSETGSEYSDYQSDNKEEIPQESSNLIEKKKEEKINNVGDDKKEEDKEKKEEEDKEQDYSLNRSKTLEGKEGKEKVSSSPPPAPPKLKKEVEVFSFEEWTEEPAELWEVDDLVEKDENVSNDTKHPDDDDEGDSYDLWQDMPEPEDWAEPEPEIWTGVIDDVAEVPEGPVKSNSI